MFWFPRAFKGKTLNVMPKKEGANISSPLNTFWAYIRVFDPVFSLSTYQTIAKEVPLLTFLFLKMEKNLRL